MPICTAISSGSAGSSFLEPQRLRLRDDAEPPSSADAAAGCAGASAGLVPQRERFGFAAGAASLDRYPDASAAARLAW